MFSMMSLLAFTLLSGAVTVATGLARRLARRLVGAFAMSGLSFIHLESEEGLRREGVRGGEGRG